MSEQSLEKLEQWRKQKKIDGWVVATFFAPADLSQELKKRARQWKRENPGFYKRLHG